MGAAGRHGTAGDATPVPAAPVTPVEQVCLGSGASPETDTSGKRPKRAAAVAAGAALRKHAKMNADQDEQPPNGKQLKPEDWC